MATPHGATTRIILDRYDLSGQMNEATISIDHPVADKTGFGDVAKSFVPGQHSFKLDVKGLYSSSGSVSAAGSIQPDGTAGSDLALYYLSNQGTAAATRGNVVGYFPEGMGTGIQGYAGRGGINGVSRGANIGNAVGITTSFVGDGPVTRVTCLGERKVSAVAGSTGAIDIGMPLISGLDAAGTAVSTYGAYCYFWILGTADFTAGTAAVYGTIQASDIASTGYSNLAIFSGTAADAYAIMATVTAGSVPRYINLSWGIDAASSGTLVAAIGRISG
jgi:hypothetical protein